MSSNKVKTMIKQNRPLQMLAAAILLLTGCAQNEATSDDTDRMVPLTIEAYSLTGELVQPGTRAVISTEGAQIGVFLTSQGDYKSAYDKKYKYSTAPAGWSATEPIYVDNRAGKVVAYYDPTGKVTFPANSFVTNANALTAQKYDETKLWYYDDTQDDVTNANAAITFKMKPAYARVILSIQRHATNYVGVCAISKVAFSTNSNQFISSGTIDISNSTPGGTAAAAWSINPAIAGIAAGATSTACDVLLPPQSLSTATNQGLTLVLTIDTQERTITIPASNFNPTKLLEPGKQYTIHLLITDTEVLPAGGVISDDYVTVGTDIKNDAPKEL